MRGRARGNQERIMALAHQTEMMARERRLKPLGSYLRKLNKSARQNEDVLAMFRGLASNGSGVKIKRINRPED